MAIQVLILTIFFLLILPAYIIYKPPRFVINYFQRRFPDVLFHISTSKRVIALTIDDAPSQHTADILDVLKANDARATFFVIGGQIPGREDLMDRIVREGHELGNHAMHDEPSISLPSSDLSDQILEVDAFISQAYKSTGVQRQERYFRPGSGIFSQRILDVATKLGYRTILGSIYPHDPFISYSWINAWHILSMARPGAVIICHDRRSWTLPMLAQVLPSLKKKGYTVTTVTGLLEAISPP